MKKTKRFFDSFTDDYWGDTPDEFAENLRNMLPKLEEFQGVLYADLDYATQLLKADGSSGARRVYIRTVPAFVEGTLNLMRVAPHGYPPLMSRLPRQYTPNFMEAMLNLRTRTGAKDSIKLTLIGFGHISGVQLSNQIMGEKGAQDLLSVFEWRNDLMHPCSIGAMDISSEQTQVAQYGLAWFYQKFVEVWTPLAEVARNMAKRGQQDHRIVAGE